MAGAAGEGVLRLAAGPWLIALTTMETTASETNELVEPQERPICWCRSMRACAGHSGSGDSAIYNLNAGSL